MSALQLMQELVPDSGWFDAQSYKMSCQKSQAVSGEEGRPPEELQDSLWRDFCGDPTQWWDNRWSKLSPLSPEFRHSISDVPWRLSNRQKPAWVDSKLAKLDAGMKQGVESVSTSGQGLEGPLEIGMSRTLCEDGRISDTVDALSLQVEQGCHIDQNLYYRVLKRCIVHKDLIMGRRIHALTAKSGYEGDAFLATQLIGLYAAHGRLEEAMQVFSKVGTLTTHNWATIIFAYGRQGEAAQAIRLYREILESTTVQPSNRVYVAVLKACATAGDLVTGREVHCHILASPGTPDIFVQTGLVSMYAKCGSLGDARRVFDGLLKKDVVAWNAMLAGYSQQGLGEEALGLYGSMQQEGLTTPDSVTFVCLLQACSSLGVGALEKGKQLHLQIQQRGLKVDLVLGGSLVNMYAKCGSLGDARQVFDKLPKKDVVAWTAMIAGYAQQGIGQEALSLYSSMQQEGLAAPDCVTYACLLQACANVGGGALDQGKQLHSQIQERGLHVDLVLGGSVVNMYANCGSLDDARQVFDRLPERNIVAWNAMLAGYSQQGMGHEALRLYSCMQEEGLTTPDSVTFVCLLQACGRVGVEALDKGKQLHLQIKKRGLKEDLALGGSLVNMYAKCGSLRAARQVFDELPDRNVVAWNAMLAAYVQQGMGHEAITLYARMQQECISLDSVTFVCLLQACGIVSALPMGKQLHSKIEERGLQADPVVGAALVNMYAKCGSMFDSQQVFDSLPEKRIEAWGALTSGYSRQGDSMVVFHLVDRMRLEGIQPDGATFLSVLTVCSHVGLVHEGRKHFRAMETDYGIIPTVEHYICMMDLLGRAGHLDEALQMAKGMHYPSNSAVWHTLLGACRKWNNVEIGQQAFELAVGVDGKDAASHVLMANIYANAQMWEESMEMQLRRVRSGGMREAKAELVD